MLPKITSSSSPAQSIDNQSNASSSMGSIQAVRTNAAESPSTSQSSTPPLSRYEQLLFPLRQVMPFARITARDSIFERTQAELERQSTSGTQSPTTDQTQHVGATTSTTMLIEVADANDLYFASYVEVIEEDNLALEKEILKSLTSSMKEYNDINFDFDDDKPSTSSAINFANHSAPLAESELTSDDLTAEENSEPLTNQTALSFRASYTSSEHQRLHRMQSRHMPSRAIKPIISTGEAKPEAEFKKKEDK